MKIVYTNNSSFMCENEDTLQPGWLVFDTEEQGIYFVEAPGVVSKLEINNTNLECIITDSKCQVQYLGNEIRILYPEDTQWVLQNGGGDTSKYYFGVKIYAPNNEIDGFKETLGTSMTDSTLYSFENNDFAGVESDGHKYSIIWLPAAAHNEDDTWTYFGAKSTNEHYIGWDYIVEWYKGEDLVDSGSVRINLANENCFEGA